MSKLKTNRDAKTDRLPPIPPTEEAGVDGKGVLGASTAFERSSPPRSADSPTAIDRDCLRQVLTFHVSGEEYAVGIFRVREITEYEGLTRIPTGPQWMRGVINLRGTVVPVIDLGSKLFIAETTVSRRTCLVIVEARMEGEDVVMALMVDGVNRVVDLTADDLEEPPAFGNRTPFGYLLGMAKVDDIFLPVLDLDRVLSATEMFSVETVSFPDEGVARGTPSRLEVGAAETG